MPYRNRFVERHARFLSNVITMPQAQSYERDSHDQDAYLFYMRHAMLASEKLPKHLDYKLPESAVARKKLQRDLLRDIDIMEVLRPRINERYERYTKAMARRKAEREKWQREQTENVSQASLARDVDRMSLQGQYDTGRHRERLELHPGKDENRALALSLANKDIRRRQANAHPSRTQDQDRENLVEDADGGDLSQQIMATARRREQAELERNGHATDNDQGYRIKQAYNYPSVPSKKVYTLDQDALPQYDSVQRSAAPQRPPKQHFEEPTPQRPPKDSFSSIVPAPAYAPPIPAKTSYESDMSAPPSRESTATPDLSTKDYSFLATAKTESGKPLRTVFINPGLRTEFLKIAATNTNRNLETCGILCGTLISNAFFISKLVIPEQESTSDTCDTVNESALFDYVDQNDLMTLGWIHTHPTQTCFMSSRDLHTHSGYQVQMAESIAIVCAPRHEPSYGTFRLTDPPGLRTILDCRQTGLFHPHGEGNVYTDAMRPGHVQELAGLGFEVVDLRPKGQRT
jgi:STAM-binding protein